MSVRIVDRMAAAMTDLDRRWKGKRLPKAFYLNADDWRDFMATQPRTVETMFGNNPPMLVTDPAFQDIPVRESSSKNSRLYNHTGHGQALPDKFEAAA